jgi:hypothetical protein
LTGPVAAQARKREHEKKYLKKFGFTTIWSRVVGVLQKKKSVKCTNNLSTVFAEEIRKVPGGVGTLKNPLSPPELLSVS